MSTKGIDEFGKGVGQKCIGCLHVHSHVPNTQPPYPTSNELCESCDAAAKMWEIEDIIAEHEEAGTEVPDFLRVALKRAKRNSK